jgi:hypothetical protein
MLFDCVSDPESGAVYFYVIEYTGKNSALVKYELSQDYLGALRVMA